MVLKTKVDRHPALKKDDRFIPCLSKEQKLCCSVLARSNVTCASLVPFPLSMDLGKLFSNWINCAVIRKYHVPIYVTVMAPLSPYSNSGPLG